MRAKGPLAFFRLLTLAGLLIESAEIILILEVDWTKAVNDSLGHGSGDALLQQVADRLGETCRSGAVIARMDDDEFLVLEFSGGPKETMALGRRIVARLGEPYRFGHVVVTQVGVSVGSARCDVGDVSLAVLITRGDRALYAAKAARSAARTLAILTRTAHERTGRPDPSEQDRRSLS